MQWGIVNRQWFFRVAVVCTSVIGATRHSLLFTRLDTAGKLVCNPMVWTLGEPCGMENETSDYGAWGTLDSPRKTVQMSFVVFLMMMLIRQNPYGVYCPPSFGFEYLATAAEKHSHNGIRHVSTHWDDKWMKEERIDLPKSRPLYSPAASEASGSGTLVCLCLLLMSSCSCLDYMTKSITQNSFFVRCTWGEQVLPLILTVLLKGFAKEQTLGVWRICTGNSLLRHQQQQATDVVSVLVHSVGGFVNCWPVTEYLQQNISLISFIIQQNTGSQTSGGFWVNHCATFLVCLLCCISENTKSYPKYLYLINLYKNIMPKTFQ